MLKQRLTYANVAATLALVFSMTGGAMAAKHYLINSTKQINPKVIKALKGKNGAAGPQGIQGVPGKEGPAGKDGLPGKEGPTGKEGPAGKDGLPGKEGPTGKEGPAGKPGGALAWAFMDREATLADAHNFSTTYTKPAEGIYCLTPTGGVSPSTSPIALLTVEWGFSSGSQLSAYINEEAPGCPTGQYEVMTWEPAGTPSDSVAFFIVIPS